MLLLPHLSDINCPELLQPYVTAPPPLAAFFGGERCWFTLHTGAAAQFWLQLSSQAAPLWSRVRRGRSKERGRSFSWRKVTLQHSCFYLSPRDACKEKTNLMDGCTFKRMQCKAGGSWHLTDPGLCLCCFQRFTFSRLSSWLPRVVLTKDTMAEAVEWTTQVPGPSRAVPTAEYKHWCLFAAPADIGVIISRTPSCPAATPPPHSAVGIHPMLCLVVLQRWFPPYGTLYHSGSWTHRA